MVMTIAFTQIQGKLFAFCFALFFFLFAFVYYYYYVAYLFNPYY